MPHTCAEHQQKIISAYTVAVHNIPQEIAPVGPMTTEKSPAWHHRIFTVRDLYYRANTKYLGLPWGNPANSMNSRPTHTGNSGNDIWISQQAYTNGANASLPYRDYRYDQDRARHQQMRFDERYNRQYSPLSQLSTISTISSSFYCRTWSEHYIDLSGQHSVQITRYHGGKSEKSTRCLQWADQGQQGQSKWCYVCCNKHLWWCW